MSVEWREKRDHSNTRLGQAAWKPMWWKDINILPAELKQWRTSLIFLIHLGPGERTAFMLWM